MQDGKPRPLPDAIQRKDPAEGRKPFAFDPFLQHGFPFGFLTDRFSNL
jgi:hypothetical protein